MAQTNAPAPQEKRLLSGKDLFFMAMGQTIGAGIITNTGLAIGLAGSGVIIAYLLAFAAFGFVLVGYLDHQRFFHYKDKPAEAVLAGQKRPVRWLIYYGLVLGILAGLIIQNGGFGGGASFAYANF